MDCDAPCESACVHYHRPIAIKEIAKEIPQTTPELCPKTADLSIDFCGIPCENPFFLSSSVVASGYEMCARALEMGWAGIVYKTIGFYHPEEASPRFDALHQSNRSFVGFKNLEQISDHSVEENMSILKRLKEHYPTKIIVSSIMGQSDEEWTALARLSQEAGCDMVECNFSCPHMGADGLGSDVGQSEELVAQYTRAVRRGTTLPILAKMTPNLGHMESPALAAISAGADGLAAINTVKCITGINCETLVGQPNIGGKSVVSGYSGRAVKPIALRFIYEMASHRGLSHVPLSGMGGIETWRDALDFITLGCGNVQITTAVMEYGYRIIDDLIGGLSHYLHCHRVDKLQDLVGAALPQICHPDQLDRTTLVYPVIDKTLCVGCGRCFISCQDGGHQAILFEGGKVQIMGNRCQGCHLCTLVCPVGAISVSKRIPKWR